MDLRLKGKFKWLSWMKDPRVDRLVWPRIRLSLFRIGDCSSMIKEELVRPWTKQTAKATAWKSMQGTGSTSLTSNMEIQVRGSFKMQSTNPSITSSLDLRRVKFKKTRRSFLQCLQEMIMSGFRKPFPQWVISINSVERCSSHWVRIKSWFDWKTAPTSLTSMPQHSKSTWRISLNYSGRRPTALAQLHSRHTSTKWTWPPTCLKKRS